jgi:DNA-binding GntR family transcriptional regulator
MALLQEIETVPDLTEQVYARLLDAICSGELAAGARLTQEELAASFQVSRQPVLQALRLLKRDGVAIDAGRRGLVVAPIDPAVIGNVYQVRAVLEGLAARLAALSGAKIDNALIARGREALACGHFPSLIGADMAFHNALYVASGNPLIAETASRHWHYIRRAMGGVLQAKGPRDWVWEEHQAIADAIKAGDAATAERRARDHCETGGRVLAKELTDRAHAAP